MEHAGESGDRPPQSMLMRVETGHHGACWCEWRQATTEHAGENGDSSNYFSICVIAPMLKSVR